MQKLSLVAGDAGYWMHKFTLTFKKQLLYEPRREKTGFLHMPKQRRISASR